MVQQAFPGGIIWITAGRESADELVTRLREVGKGLKDDLAGYDTNSAASIATATSCARKPRCGRRWNAREIEPFRAESPRSRLLFTTRDGSIRDAVGAEQVIAGLLTPEQGGLLLAKWATLKPEDLPRKPRTTVATHPTCMGAQFFWS